MVKIDIFDKFNTYPSTVTKHLNNTRQPLLQFLNSYLVLPSVL